MDVLAQISAVRRELQPRQRDGREVNVVVAEQTYRTDIDDLWDALTNAERLPRWFLPVTGDLRVGGRYQFVGNAGGSVLGCDPPRQASLTWEFGGEVSWLDLRLAPL